MGRDVAQQRQEEQQQQDSVLRLPPTGQEGLNRHYVELFERAPVGYLTLDSDRRIVQANQAAAELLGVPAAELVGTALASFIHGEDRARLHCLAGQPSGNPERQGCDLRMVRRDAMTFWAQLRCATKSETDGEELCLVAFGDITANKLAEQALQEQKEFFHLIAENLSDFIAVLDLDGRRLYNSPSYKQLFGTERDLYDTDSFVEIHPDDREHVRQVFQDTVRTGQGQRIEYRFLTADGGIRDMESRGSVIKDQHGHVVRVVVVSQDITERKRLQDQVRQMAFHDSLTGLPNRRLFDDRFNQALAASTRSNTFGALIFVDLDNFKLLNDSHGHDAGDQLLIEVAIRLKRCVREMDTVARFGGDEFVVMLGQLDVERKDSLDQARKIADKLRHALAEPYRLTINLAENGGGKPFDYYCTASIGVSLFSQNDTSQIRILKRADSAMYQAKQSGGDRVRFGRCPE
ncbi:MAG TPA: diguanylate cyclase [Azonexus sp.]